LFFSLLYNTGARVSEILQLRPSHHQGRAVFLQGKGRKERTVPLWNSTARQLRQWIQSNDVAPDQRVFTNYRGEPLSREGVAFRLKSAVQMAAVRCPSLCVKRITPHTFRHTSAMHLLQSGVALEVIALWLGHERPATTHGYVQADLLIKQQCLDRLERPAKRRHQGSQFNDSRLLAFLEAV
jgi:integrase/recombinase XerD